MLDPIVIVGAGQAAAQAIQSLRQGGSSTGPNGGFKGPIALVGDEPVLPYQRPPLSKKYLTGEMDADRLLFRPETVYRDWDVDLHIGVRAEAIDTAAARVRLADGTTLPYGKLLIATGMRPRPLPIAGADLPGVLTLRGLADAARIKAALTPGARLVVIGGGYIGLETAAVARALGHEVVVLEAAERVLGRVVAPVVSEFFTAKHRRAGVDLRTATGVVGIEGTDRVRAVALADGGRVEADVVLISIGALPETRLAEAAGLDVADGIRVDQGARTSAENVFAAGDCTRFDSARFGRSIRLESVQNAIDQAKAAVATMLGETVVYDPVPWFWSDQYDLKLQIVGLSTGHDRYEVDGDPASEKFSVAYFAGDRLLAVDSINHPRRHMQARKLVGETWAGWPA